LNKIDQKLSISDDFFKKKQKHFKIFKYFNIPVMAKLFLSKKFENRSVKNVISPMWWFYCHFQSF